jgi:HTH-type transcriptional regulator/antitoxin HigA
LWGHALSLTKSIREPSEQVGVDNLPPVRVIHDDAEHAAALEQYQAALTAQPEPGTPLGDRLELLGVLIAVYEDKRWPIPPAEPREVIRLVMEGRGYGPADLATVLGSRSQASEILSGRRSLSVENIRALSRLWFIPPSALLGSEAL